MNQLFALPTALCLPVPDIEALIQGRTIVAMPKMFIRPGQRFALYPTKALHTPLSFERYYHSGVLPIAKTAAVNLDNSQKVLIKAWAKCELCQILDGSKPLDILSQLTIWTPEGLKEILRQQEHIFLTYLRVYQLPQVQEISVNTQVQEKLGKFISVPNSLSGSEAHPILSDRIFAQRKNQLEKLEPAQHDELEKLQSQLTQLCNINPAAQQLNDDINIFLGWSSKNPDNFVDSDLVWIEKIAEIGNSSDGHQFEKLVRRGLLKLGFTGSGLDPNSTGGAGGMDFYAEAPYPIVGECKATKTERVSDGTPAQLLKIGMNHLGKAQYDNSLKLIVAAGELNFYALRTATENQMNVISPETLQTLVELQAQYQNSINLLELKKCLQQAPFGLADDKVNNYIEKIKHSVKLRSQIIKAVKELAEQDDQNSKTAHQGFTVTEIRVHYNATHNPKQTDHQVREFLIELSSPLTGYLGRDVESDRFYYLRDLPTNSK